VLWHKIAVQYTASFSVYACKYGQAVRQAVERNFEFLQFLKIQYPAISRGFLVLNASFNVGWTSTIL